MADISIEFLCNSLQEKAFIISQQMRAHHRSLQESSLRYWRKAMVVAYEKTQSLTWYASSSKTKWHEKPSTRSDRIKRFATGRLLRRVLNSTIRRSLVSTPKVMGHDMDKNNWYSDRFPNGGKLNKPSFFGVAAKKKEYILSLAKHKLREKKRVQMVNSFWLGAEKSLPKVVGKPKRGAKVCKPLWCCTERGRIWGLQNRYIYIYRY